MNIDKSLLLSAKLHMKMTELIAKFVESEFKEGENVVDINNIIISSAVYSAINAAKILVGDNIELNETYDKFSEGFRRFLKEHNL